MNTTNDEQAPYGKPTDSAPLLSDADLTISMYEPSSEEWKLRLYNKCKEIRDFYEAKITSGELRVVKTIPRSEAKEHVLNCHDDMGTAMDTGFADYILFCPGCGAQIVKP